MFGFGWSFIENYWILLSLVGCLGSGSFYRSRQSFLCCWLYFRWWLEIWLGNYFALGSRCFYRSWFASWFLIFMFGFRWRMERVGFDFCWWNNYWGRWIFWVLVFLHLLRHFLKKILGLWVWIGFESIWVYPYLNLKFIWDEFFFLSNI